MARVRGKRTPAVVLGFNKDHRPDLKQLLYKLTVSSDGSVPIAFGVDSGNVNDEKTHRKQNSDARKIRYKIRIGGRPRA